jgi:hypothetical protein
MKNLKNFALFEARISKSSSFSKGFLSNFPILASLIYDSVGREISKIGGSATIDYATRGDHSLLVIKVDGAKDIVLGLMGIKEPETKRDKWSTEWIYTSEILGDDLIDGLKSDSGEIHECLNSISSGFSVRPDEYLNSLAAAMFSYPVQFRGERWISPDQISERVKKDIQESWPDPSKMQNYIYTQGRSGENSCMEGICRNFVIGYLAWILEKINEAKLQAAKTGRIMSDLDVSDVFKSDTWRNLQQSGWTNASTDRVLRNKSIVLQNSNIGLGGGNSGSISIVNSGYVRKVYPSGSGLGNIVLKKFSPFVTLEDYNKALEYVSEYTFKKILADAGLKVGSKKLNSMEDLAQYVADTYKEGNLESLSKSWSALPQPVKDRAIELSGDPGFERMIRAFSDYRGKII